MDQDALLQAGLQGARAQLEQTLSVFESATPSAIHALLQGSKFAPFATPADIDRISGLPYDTSMSIPAFVELFVQVCDDASARWAAEFWDTGPDPEGVGGGEVQG